MNIIIFGGAGFIGSYLVEHYLKVKDVKKLVVYDNFSSGRLWHLKDSLADTRLTIENREIANLVNYKPEIKFDLVVMLAANPDIAKAEKEPSIDFDEGTVLMQKVLEFMRIYDVKRLLYASGSGVYGDVGAAVCAENHGPLIPISTYGASKLACEALISSYVFMFGLKASCFRFGNVVGGRQTHGVAYDFILRLRKNPKELTVLGDGNQSKPYVFIDDIVQALECVFRWQERKFEVYNVAPDDYITVNEIATIVINELQLDADAVNICHSGGDRGWKGDVPIVRLDTRKIAKSGWISHYSSAEAITQSVRGLLANIESIENHVE
jgi:UDP-glucose 4-epimerase